MLYFVGIIVGIYLGVMSHDGDGFIIGGIVGFLFIYIIKLKEKVTNLEQDIESFKSGLKEKAINQEKYQEFNNNNIETPIEPQKPVISQPDSVEIINQDTISSESISTPYKNVENDNEPLSDQEFKKAEAELEELTQASVKIETIEDVKKFAYSNSIETMDADDFEEKVEKIQPLPREPSKFDLLLDKAKALIVGYFTGGNLIVRIGLLVLFVGVAFLLKYVAERTTVPVEFRYIGISAGCLIMLVLGWKLRIKRPGYALSLLGGGIGVLYLTLFAAMRLHGLLSAKIVILLLIAIVLLSAILAILTNSMALAVIGMIGGYAAPILTSTGSGSHVHLFSYYLLLNVGVFIIAWFKSWRILNVIGFIATFGIGSIWGYKYYTPENLWTVEPFLIVNFLMYTFIALLFAIKQAPNLKGLNDATLIFGTPLVGFSLQAGLMKDIEYGLAYSALALGAFYILLSYIVHKFNKDYLKSLIESFVALGIGFATLAIPLGFDGRVTSAMWVAEGSALVWVGLRQSRMFPRFSGYALTLFGSFAFFTENSSHQDMIPWLNADYIGILIIFAATAFISLYARAHSDKLLKFETPLVPNFMLVFSLLWWIFGGVNEIDQFYHGYRFSLIQLFLALSTTAIIVSYEKINFQLMKTCAFLMALGMLLVLDLMPNLNLEIQAIINDRFLGLMILALFHFVLSWYWRSDKPENKKIPDLYYQSLFIFSSIALWMYAFITELRLYYSADEFLLIEILMATTAIFVLTFGVLKNNIQYKIASVVIVLLMFFPMSLAASGNPNLSPLLNASLLGYLVYSLTQLSMAWFWQRKAQLSDPLTKIWSLNVSHIMMFSGLLAWYLRGMYEIDIYLPKELTLSMDLVFTIVSSLFFILLAHQINWKSLHLLKYTYLPIIVMIALLQLITLGDFHHGYGLYAWLFAFIFNYWYLRIYDNKSFQFIHFYHITSLFVFVFVAVYEFAEWVENLSLGGSIWHKSSYSVMLLLISSFMFFIRNVNHWPINKYKQYYYKVCLPVFIIVLWVMSLVLNLSPPGTLKLIGYLPILNSIDLMTIASLVLSWKLLKDDPKVYFLESKSIILIILSSLGFLLINASMLRCFHYWYEIPYKWTTMWSSFMIQTGFSILWTLTAMSLMVIASRKKWRQVWLIGLGLIITVVIKLFLVDMSASGTIERIVAFLTVGILLSVVGYFSPLPPDAKLEDKVLEKK